MNTALRNHTSRTNATVQHGIAGHGLQAPTFVPALAFTLAGRRTP